MARPATSPCLSPWSVCLSELRRNLPTSLDELMDTVNQFAASLDEEEIRKASSNIRFRAKAYMDGEDGAFEYKLKKLKRRAG